MASISRGQGGMAAGALLAGAVSLLALPSAVLAFTSGFATKAPRPSAEPEASAMPASRLAARLAPGGLMVLSTPNRTPQSRLLLVGAAERIGAIPKGTHHWDDFVTPDELRELLWAAGLTMAEPRGISWSPMKGLHLSADLSLNYIVTAQKT